MAAAEHMQLIPHAGQPHHFYLTMAHLNPPLVGYFPSTSESKPLAAVPNWTSQ